MENSFYNSLLHDESFDTCLFFGISFIFQFLCVSDLLFSSSKCFIQKLLFFLSNDSLKGSSGRVHFTWLLLKLQGQCLARRQLTVDISLTGANTARLCFYATSKARSQNKNRGGKKAFRRLPWANRVKHSSVFVVPMKSAGRKRQTETRSKQRFRKHRLVFDFFMFWTEKDEIWLPDEATPCNYDGSQLGSPQPLWSRFGLKSNAPPFSCQKKKVGGGKRSSLLAKKRLFSSDLVCSAGDKTS